ncbi:hypothetical protein KV697_10730 [Sphingomonas sanguinis]|uniref:hypothetical protein n=1 Tax=Sphingomonas sanguinis TaxID=33051 RepID=UPI001C580CBE|nr:hypothetical protein [Sphingomonas sanguinis]QXT34309.1 hypothetical protein KV697_10730 [Sphingomonas sanguinis]
MTAPADRTPADRTPYDPLTRSRPRRSDAIGGAVIFCPEPRRKMLCDIDELVIALSEARVARDRIARQLPEGHVQDTPEQTLLVQRLNNAFRHLSQTILDLRQALDAYMDARIIVDITPECGR